MFSRIFDSNCDEIPQLPSNLNGKILTYTTSQNGDKFSENYIEWISQMNNSIDYNIEINVNKQYQKILGFGGAFTDAMIVNLNKLE